MKKLIAVLLLLPSLAFAQGTDLYMAARGSTVGALNPNVNIPQSRRIAVIFDSDGDTYGPYRNTTSKDLHNCLGSFFERLEMAGGAQVSYFSTGYLQRNLWLWQHMGDPGGYGLAILYNVSAYNAGGAGKTRYLRPDSTSIQCISVMSSDITWNQGGANLGDCDTLSGFLGLAKAPRQFMVYGTTDTASCDRFAYGVRVSTTLPAGISRVVRYFQPIITASTSYGTQSDTSFAVMPAAGDSIAKPWEIMPVAWKVVWTASGKWMDFFKLPTSTDFGSNTAHLLWGLVSRYTSIAPIKFAVEFDDLTDASPTTATFRRTAAGMDSITTELSSRWGIARLVTDMDPGSFPGYYNGTTPGFESAWTQGIGYGAWMEKIKFTAVHHSHDSTAVRQTSNLVGRYGGNLTANGLTVAGTGADVGNIYYRYSPRYASRWDPTNGQNWKRWGIAQRLQIADSIARATCRACPRPPYLSFPNNEILPYNWTTRGTTAYANNPYGVVAGDVIGLDSLWFAFHAGLAGGASDVVYLRQAFGSSGSSAVALTGTRQQGGTFYNNYAAFDRDSFPMSNPFGAADEHFTVKDPSGKYEVRCVGSVNGNVSGVLTSFRSASNRVIASLLGFQVIQQRGGSPAENGGESQNADPNGMGTNVTPGPNRIGSSLNPQRMIYIHPQSLASTDWELARISWLPHLRVMNDLAGRACTMNVYPWELYTK